SLTSAVVERAPVPLRSTRNGRCSCCARPAAARSALTLSSGCGSCSARVTGGAGLLLLELDRGTGSGPGGFAPDSPPIRVPRSPPDRGTDRVPDVQNSQSGTVMPRAPSHLSCFPSSPPTHSASRLARRLAASG